MKEMAPAIAMNQLRNEKGLNCARNNLNYAGHIWDKKDAEGLKGATACIAIPWFTEQFDKGADRKAMAYWIHDHLP